MNKLKKFLTVVMLAGLLLIPTGANTKNGFYMSKVEAASRNLCTHTGYVGGWCETSIKCRSGRKMVYCWQQPGGSLCCEEECATVQQCP